MALNVKTVKRWWIWTPESKSDDGSEHWNWEYGFKRWTKTRWWLWTLKLKSNDGSECRNWDEMMTLNAESEKRWWLWTSKLRSDYGSEHQNQESMMALNTKTENMALNIELKRDGGSERQNWELRTDISECQTKKDDSKRRNWKAMMALNIVTKKRWWLWIPKLRSNDDFEC